MLQEMMLPSLPKEIIPSTSQYFTLVIPPCSLNHFYLIALTLTTARILSLDAAPLLRWESIFLTAGVARNNSTGGGQNGHKQAGQSF